MTPSTRTGARLLTRAAVLAFLLAVAARGTAQETEEPRHFCRVGRPQPACERVLVAQFTYYPGLQPSGNLDSPIEWEVGVHRGAAQTLGATVVLGVDGNGLRAAAKGRYRRWLSRHAALDASGGVAYARRDPYPYDPAFGLTGDVAVGFTEWVSVGVRGDLMWSRLDGAPAAATYGVVRLGTRPGIVVTVVGLVLGVIAGSVSG
jgi:hypothetical protein